jgi:hypothetical protein
MDCRECHPGAYAALPGGQPNPTASQKSADVMLPDMQNCMQCHRPKGFAGSGGGVRHDCTTCHRYHNYEQPLEGPGASAFNPATRLTTAEILGGAKITPAEKRDR